MAGTLAHMELVALTAHSQEGNVKIFFVPHPPLFSYSHRLTI